MSNTRHQHLTSGTSWRENLIRPCFRFSIRSKLKFVTDPLSFLVFLALLRAQVEAQSCPEQKHQSTIAILVDEISDLDSELAGSKQRLGKPCLPIQRNVPKERSRMIELCTLVQLVSGNERGETR